MRDVMHIGHHSYLLLVLHPPSHSALFLSPEIPDVPKYVLSHRQHHVRRENCDRKPVHLPQKGIIHHVVTRLALGLLQGRVRNCPFR